MQGFRGSLFREETRSPAPQRLARDPRRFRRRPRARERFLAQGFRDAEHTRREMLQDRAPVGRARRRTHEAEINTRLADVTDDVAGLRRAFVDHALVVRTADGSAYSRT